MYNEISIPAKATSPAEQSDGVVVSFGADWHEPLLAKAFSLVIRKRIPKCATFNWLYFHINAPISALCGRARIQKVLTLTEKEAIAHAKQIHLPPAEIKSYIEGDSKIGCYKLGAFEFGKMPVSAARLSTRLVYHPPQSFFILSKEAKKIIDAFSGFLPLKVTKSLRGLKS